MNEFKYKNAIIGNESIRKLDNSCNDSWNTSSYFQILLYGISGHCFCYNFMEDIIQKNNKRDESQSFCIRSDQKSPLVRNELNQNRKQVLLSKTLMAGHKFGPNIIVMLYSLTRARLHSYQREVHLALNYRKKQFT